MQALNTSQSTRRCHSHRLYSHSCDCRSKLWSALFGGLTVDQANFWPLTFDRSDTLPAKESDIWTATRVRKPVCQEISAPCMCNLTQQVRGELQHCNLVHSTLGSERWPSFWLRFDRWPCLFGQFDHWLSADAAVTIESMGVTPLWSNSSTSKIIM